jgi:hypothetical protein
MRYIAVTLLFCTLLLTNCASKRAPVPVIGVDIMSVKAGDKVLFDGTLFSSFYLNEYLQWKDTK